MRSLLIRGHMVRTQAHTHMVAAGATAQFFSVVCVLSSSRTLFYMQVFSYLCSEFVDGHTFSFPHTVADICLLAENHL